MNRKGKLIAWLSRSNWSQSKKKQLKTIFVSKAGGRMSSAGIFVTRAPAASVSCQSSDWSAIDYGLVDRPPPPAERLTLKLWPGAIVGLWNFGHLTWMSWDSVSATCENAHLCPSLLLSSHCSVFLLWWLSIKLPSHQNTTCDKHHLLSHPCINKPVKANS